MPPFPSQSGMTLWGTVSKEGETSDYRSSTILRARRLTLVRRRRLPAKRKDRTCQLRRLPHIAMRSPSLHSCACDGSGRSQRPSGHNGRARPRGSDRLWSSQHLRRQTPLTREFEHVRLLRQSGTGFQVASVHSILDVTLPILPSLAGNASTSSLGARYEPTVSPRLQHRPCGSVPEGPTSIFGASLGGRFAPSIFRSSPVGIPPT